MYYHTRKKSYKKNVKKLKSDFIPHSLISYKETQENKMLCKLLVNVFLFYSIYQITPPIEYLSFIFKTEEKDIKEALGYLSHHNWFSIMIVRGKYLYHITDKFVNAFYQR